LVTERSAVYLDASAVVKLVVEEAGSAQLSAYLLARPQRATSRITQVEVHRAAARAGVPSAPDRLTKVLDALTLIELDASLAASAASLRPASLRTLDAIHLATALALLPDLESFVTYDQRLVQAAASAGMSVVSPGVELAPSA
jgi:predicted nucleic acid-binding protein